MTFTEPCSISNKQFFVALSTRPLKIQDQMSDSAADTAQTKAALAEKLGAKRSSKARLSAQGIIPDRHVKHEHLVSKKLLAGKLGDKRASRVELEDNGTIPSRHVKQEHLVSKKLLAGKLGDKRASRAELTNQGILQDRNVTQEHHLSKALLADKLGERRASRMELTEKGILQAEAKDVKCGDKILRITARGAHLMAPSEM